MSGYRIDHVRTRNEISGATSPIQQGNPDTVISLRVLNATHPNAKVVATILRAVHSTNRHSWGVVAWIDGKTYQPPACERDVVKQVKAFAKGGPVRIQRWLRKSLSE